MRPLAALPMLSRLSGASRMLALPPGDFERWRRVDTAEISERIGHVDNGKLGSSALPCRIRQAHLLLASSAPTKKRSEFRWIYRSPSLIERLAPTGRCVRTANVLGGILGRHSCFSKTPTARASSATKHHSRQGPAVPLLLAKRSLSLRQCFRRESSNLYPVEFGEPVLPSKLCSHLSVPTVDQESGSP